MEPKITSSVESTKHKMITRTILIIMGVAVIAEILWAGYSLTKPPMENSPQASPPAEVAPSAVLTLTGPSMVSKDGEFRVDINLTTADKTDSADIIITYDPKFLSVVPVTKASPKAGEAGKEAVATGTIYQDFPINTYDAKTGKITLSAIADPKQNSAAVAGKIGYITFKAVSTGATAVAIDYEPGSTTRSIVLSTKSVKNILSQVKNLTLDIK